MADVWIHHALTFLFLIGLGGGAIGTGHVILNKMRIAFSGTDERIFYSLGLGLAVMAYTVFLFGILQAIYPAVIYALATAFALIGLPGCIRLGKQIANSGAYTPQSGFERLACFILLICLSILFLLVLIPEIGKDALIYHLAVPKLFIEHHGFYFIDGNVFANYPLFGEMLYMVGLILQGDILAKGIPFILLLFILLGIGLFIRRRIGKDSFPYLAMLILISVPSVFITAHMAYNDFFVTYYCLGAVFTFISWSEQNDRGWLILCGLFSGLAVACKYTALLLPFLGILGMLWAARSRKLHVKEATQNLFIYAIFLVLAGSPFYIKNWVTTGNPVYPFLYSIFGGAGWEPGQARLYDLFVHTLGMGKEPLDYLLLPWNVSLRAKMDSLQFDGILGPVFLFLLPFALGLRKQGHTMTIILVYCACTLLFWAASAQQIRYLIPVLPLLSILIVFILSYYRDRKGITAILIILISASLTFNFYYVARDFLKIKPLGVVFGLESRDDFLRRTIPQYGMYNYVNRQLPPDAKVFLIYMKNYGFLCNRTFYSDSMFESYTLQKILSSSRNVHEVREMLKKKRFTHMMFDVNYVTGDWSTLSPEEKRIFAAFQSNYLTYVTGDKSYLLYQLK